MKFTFDQYWKVGALLLASGGLVAQIKSDHDLLLEQRKATKALENQVTVLEVVVERIDPLRMPFGGDAH